MNPWPARAWWPCWVAIPRWKSSARVPTVSSALAAIRTQRPDLVFLDVQMPKKDGFTVLAELKPEDRPAVIFVTAYDQYAIEAFAICAIDYLLKPFRDARFVAALARAKAEIRRERGRRLESQDGAVGRLRAGGRHDGRGAGPDGPGVIRWRGPRIASC